jgi:hypothetical protein
MRSRRVHRSRPATSCAVLAHGADRRGGLRESDAVVVQQFVDALMNAGADGTVRG